MTTQHHELDDAAVVVVEPPDSRRDALERLVRALLPAGFSVRWAHSPGPHSTCHVELCFDAAFSVHEGTPDAVIVELVDVTRCHVLRLVARALVEGL